MALTKVTGQVINSTTDLSVGVATVGGGTSTGDLYVVGVSTLVGDLSLNGNVTIGGTLTYEDVTNIDAVGLITARSGISVTGVGVTIALGGLNVNAGISTFNDNVLIGGPSHTSRPLAVHATTNSVVLIEGNSDGTSSLMLGDNDDEDVGMIQYNHADNDLAFTVNTGEALAIKSDGQLVASGTGSELNLTNTGSTATEDTAVLYTSVSGVHNRVLIKTSTNNGGDPYIKFDGGGQDMIVGTRYAGTTNNLLVLGPGNNPDTTSGIFVKGTGLVGVGTDSPARILHLNGSDSDTVQLHITNSTTGPAGTDGVSFALGSDERLIINQRESNSIVLKTADTDRLTITADGDVGIGTTSPRAIAGYKGLTLNHVTHGGFIQFQDDGTNTSSVLGGTNSLNISTQTSIPILFYTAGTEKLRITSGGQVNIGANFTQTTYPFSVEGSSNTTAIIKCSGNDTANFYFDANRTGASANISLLSGLWNGTRVADIRFLTGSDTSNKDDGQIALYTASAGSPAERFRIDSNGNITKPSHCVFKSALTNSFGSSGSLTTTTANCGILQASAVINRGSHYTTSGDNAYTFVCPVAGIYRVDMALSFGDSQSGRKIYVMSYTTGGGNLPLASYNELLDLNPTNHQNVSYSAIWEFTAGTRIGVGKNGGSGTITGEHMEWAVTLVA